MDCLKNQGKNEVGEWGQRMSTGTGEGQARAEEEKLKGRRRGRRRRGGEEGSQLNVNLSPSVGQHTRIKDRMCTKH